MTMNEDYNVEENYTLAKGEEIVVDLGGGRPGCFKSVTECADVSLPVSIKPYAIMGRVHTECVGEPIIRYCHSGDSRDGCGKCEITVTQALKIKIPIEYGAVADAGRSHVKCKPPHGKDDCSCKDPY